MDLATFLTKIQLFSRFPEGTMQYASNVAGKISDAERAGLYTKLEKAYGEYVTLDDARIAQQSTMIEELVNFK